MPKQEKPGDEIKLSKSDEAALDSACDEVGAKALAELGISPARIRELQAMPPGERATKPAK